MKKNQYIAPSICVTAIIVEHMIANSAKSVAGAEGLGKGDDVASGVANAKRNDYNVWSDDWNK